VEMLITAFVVGFVSALAAHRFHQKRIAALLRHLGEEQIGLIDNAENQPCSSIRLECRDFCRGYGACREEIVRWFK